MHNYRPEIDGLRALAVIPVILFHAGFNWANGGFIGVDIFFVISGYLITTIIYSEINSNQFSLGKFYHRRARRILPALVLVSFLTVPLAWFWLLPDEFINFSESLIGVATFSSNIIFWRQSNGYFQPNSELIPLLHTWSLAIEEQFYIFFPLILLFTYKISNKIVLPLLILISILSFILALWSVEIYPSAAFYLLPTRAWELGFGSIIAIYLLRNNVTNSLLTNLLAIIGLIFIVISFIIFDSTTPFPSVWSLIPIIGIGLLIMFARNNVISKLLSFRPFVLIGLISYSAYLFHQPIFAFMRIRSNFDIPLIYYLIAITFTFILAYFNWKFVETPFRMKNKISTKLVVVLSIASLSILLLIGTIGIKNNGFPDRFSTKLQKIINIGEERSPHSACLNEMPLDFDKHCLLSDSNQNLTLVWGDSHAAELAWHLSSNENTPNLNIQLLSYGACPPTLGIKKKRDSKGCEIFNEKTMEYISNNKNIKNIILLARWSMYTEGTVYNNGEGGHFGSVIDLIPDRNFLLASNNNIVSAKGMAYRKTINDILDLGKNVILVYPIPEVGIDVQNFITREKHLNNKDIINYSTNFDAHKKYRDNTHKEFNLLEKNESLLNIYPEDIFCNTYIPNRCAAQLDTLPIYFDENHLNKIGGFILAENIYKNMKLRNW
ncbi:acyltransferase [Pelagibacterales bacterium SAG-MED32]|nr:acyltransferase [Pelagibacterales bacterium SAG-MED32]